MKGWDDGTNSAQSLSSNIELSSNITLQFVRYDVRESSTKAEKDQGKYKCIATITDLDRLASVEKANEIMTDMITIRSFIDAEKETRAIAAYSNVLYSRAEEYNSLAVVASLLGYSSLIPPLSGDLSLSNLDIQRNKIHSDLLSSGLATGTSTNTADIESKLIERLWNTANANKNAKEYSSGEGVYSKTYKIGDAGPGGGIVFYDKGSFSDGWRYLEVATKDIKGTFSFGKSGSLGTKNALGAGEANTQSIVNLNGATGNYAAMLCYQYEEGGFTDWYLPSIDELKMINDTVRTNKNVNMTKAGYWSSSQLSNSYALGFSYQTRKQFSDSMSKKYYVRPVRAF